MDNLTATPIPPIAPPGGAEGMGPLFTMVASLFLIIGLLLLGFYLLRRFGPRGGFGGSKQLRFEGQLALGPRRSVVVVRFLNRLLVLGVTEQQINLLTEAEVGHDDSNGFEKVLEKSRPDGDPS